MVDDIPKNHQFESVVMEAPEKDDWFNWFQSKYAPELDDEGNIVDDSPTTMQDKNRSSLIVEPEVINKFYDKLETEDLAYNDPVSEVRTSPRRVEQIMVYVNNNLPVTSMVHAQQLMSFVKTNFTHYQTGEVSGLYDKYANIVSELIKETSGIDVTKEDTLPATQWRSQLKNQIDTKLKTGEERTYPICLSGQPGTSKTTSINELGEDKKMLVIYKDCATVSAEEAIGLPITKDVVEQGKEIEVEFTEQCLKNILEIIMKELKNIKFLEENTMLYTS